MTCVCYKDAKLNDDPAVLVGLVLRLLLLHLHLLVVVHVHLTVVLPVVLPVVPRRLQVLVHALDKISPSRPVSIPTLVLLDEVVHHAHIAFAARLVEVEDDLRDLLLIVCAGNNLLVTAVFQLAVERVGHLAQQKLRNLLLVHFGILYSLSAHNNSTSAGIPTLLDIHEQVVFHQTFHHQTVTPSPVVLDGVRQSLPITRKPIAYSPLGHDEADSKHECFKTLRRLAHCEE